MLLAGCGPAGAEGWLVHLSGSVADVDAAPVAGAEVTLASAEGELIGVSVADADGAWSLPVYGDTLLDNVVVALVRAEGFAEGRATFEIELRAPDVVTLRAGPLQTWQTSERRLAAVRLAPDADAAFVIGRVIDAVTAEPVDGIALSLQRGWNAAIGDPAVDDTVTADGGAFRFDATPAGVYTVSASATAAWGGARFPVILTDDGGEGMGLVAPPIEAGQLRASIVWGDRPSDLDLHLSAPLRGGQAGVDGTGRYHVWSGTPFHPDRADDESEYEAVLERAASTGRGPETVLMRSAPGAGEIKLSVFDNDNRSDADNVALATSGAVMQVWYGEDYPRYYTIAPGAVATLWRPVEVDAQTAVPYAVETYSVGVVPEDPTAF